MKTNLILFQLIYFLSACDSIPYRPVYQLKFFSGHCAIRCFNYNTLKITKDKDCGENFISNLKLPMDFCDGVIGPNIIDYADDIKPAVLEAIQKCKDESD